MRRSKEARGGAGRRELRAHAPDEHRRADRVAAELERVLSELLLRRTKDPRLGSVTITAVKLSPDLRLARVFFTLLDDRADRAEVLRGLGSAAPFLRRGVAAGLGLRYTPELVFAYDAALEGARRIDSLLRGLQEADAGREAASSPAPGDTARVATAPSDGEEAGGDDPSGAGGRDRGGGA